MNGSQVRRRWVLVGAGYAVVVGLAFGFGPASVGIGVAVIAALGVATFYYRFREMRALPLARH